MDISFLLPCYNVARWVEDCILSISSQMDGKLDYEILCVDDCSSDSTYDILIKIASQNKHVCVLKNDTNHGVSYSRNVALRHSSGKYVWFIDPDDILIDGAVASFFALAEKNSVDVVVGDFARMDENDDPSPYCDRFCEQQYTEMEIGDNLSVLPKRLEGSYASGIWTSLYLRDFLVKNNLNFNENVHYGEDHLFLLKIGLKDKRVIRTNYPCYLYRQQKTSAMNKPKKDKLIRLYHSYVGVYNEYLQLKNTITDCDNQRKIQLLMLKTREKICTTLIQINQYRFVSSQLKQLKKTGVFPVPQKCSKKITVTHIVSSNELCFWAAWFVCNIFKGLRSDRS